MSSFWDGFEKRALSHELAIRARDAALKVSKDISPEKLIKRLGQSSKFNEYAHIRPTKLWTPQVAHDQALDEIKRSMGRRVKTHKEDVEDMLQDGMIRHFPNIASRAK